MRGLRMAAMLAMAPLAGCVGVLDIDIDGNDVDLHGSGFELTEGRSAHGFEEIEVHGVGRIVIEVGFEDRVEITADDNILPILESRVIGDRLILGPESGYSIHPLTEIVYRVTVRYLDRLSISGVIEADVFGVDTGRFEVAMSGVTHLVVDGIADRLDVQLSGVANFDAPDLESFEADIHASGASRATVWARDYLEVHGSGAAQIRYRGHPELRIFVSGAAWVQRY